jgi:hypothetical protein
MRDQRGPVAYRHNTSFGAQPARVLCGAIEAVAEVQSGEISRRRRPQGADMGRYGSTNPFASSWFHPK